MQIVKRDGTEIQFDTSKIVEAISKVLMDLAERIDEISRACAESIHEVAHTIFSFFASLFGRSTKRKKVLPGVFYTTFMLVPNLKHIMIIFHEHSCEVRKVYLINRFHRGNTDDIELAFSCN